MPNCFDICATLGLFWYLCDVKLALKSEYDFFQFKIDHAKILITFLIPIISVIFGEELVYHILDILLIFYIARILYNFL